MSDSKTLTAVLNGAGIRPAREPLNAMDAAELPPGTRLGGDPKTRSVPSHYDKAIQPWDLQRCMESSGNLFVDARRTDVIEYAFRMKGDRKQLRDDLLKAIDCLKASVEELEREGICG